MNIKRLILKCKRYPFLNIQQSCCFMTHIVQSIFCLSVWMKQTFTWIFCILNLCKLKQQKCCYFQLKVTNVVNIIFCLFSAAPIKQSVYVQIDCLIVVIKYNEWHKTLNKIEIQTIS